MQLKIDDNDFSEYLTKRGYNVTYKKIMGVNSFYTLDGTYHEDILARKAVVVADLKPMTSAQLAVFIDACDDCEYATYLDTKTNTTVTKKAIATVSSASIALNKNNILHWASGGNGITLTIEER